MIKTLLKHKLLETCINVMFDSVTENFMIPIKHEFKVGQKYNKLIFKSLYTDMTNTGLKIVEYHNCTITSVFKFFIDSHHTTLKFDAVTGFESKYAPNGKLISYETLYYPVNRIHGTSGLIHYD